MSSEPERTREVFDLYVDGEPKGQPRPRAFSLNGKARVYDSGTAEGFKSAIAVAAKRAGLENRMLEGAVAVQINAWFRRPKSHLKKSGEVKPGAPAYKTSVPDCDNVEKAVLDALTQIGAWRDDAQVADCHTRKRYERDPSTYVRIERIG